MRTLSLKERELLGVQEQPDLDPKNYPTDEAFGARLDELGIPRTVADDAPIVSVESLVYGRLAEALKGIKRN